MRTEDPADTAERRLAGAPSPDDGEESDTSLARWLPDAPAGGTSGWLATVRADPGRAGVVALVAVGVVAVLVTVFTSLRDDGSAVTSAKLPAVQPVSSASPTTGLPPAGPVVVSVVGLVHQPGLVTLDAGARIADALTAAGGPLDGADLVGLNMARRVDDGEQIVVGLAAPPGAPGMRSSVTTPTGTTAGATGAATPAVVNLNTATVEELDALPGVGPVTAAAIVAWRTANGRFANVDQLGEVDGIGPARLEKLRALVET